MAFVPSTSEQRLIGPAAASMEALRQRLEATNGQRRTLETALFERQAPIHEMVDELLALDPENDSSAGERAA